MCYGANLTECVWSHRSAGSGACQCYESWSGHNCQRMRLAPLPPVAGYGEAPNVTSWGGSIFKNISTGEYHLFVTEETDGKGNVHTQPSL